MSVQRWSIERGAPAWVAGTGEFITYADHARLVAAKDARIVELVDLLNDVRHELHDVTAALDEARGTGGNHE